MGSAFSSRTPRYEDDFAKIHTDKTSYAPGDKLSGRIYLHISFPHPPSELVLRLEAVEGFHRIVRVSKGQHLDENSRKFINSSWCLHHYDTGLDRGQLEIPFSLTLPEELPSSFHQEGVTFLAYITYFLVVVFMPLDKKDPKPLSLWQYQRLVIRNPVNRAAKSHNEDIRAPLSTWCCVPRGFLTLRVHFERDLYTQGGTVRVTLEVDNSSSNLDNLETQVQLMQKLRLNAIIYDLVIATVSIPGTKAKTKSEPKFVMFDVPRFIGDEHNLETRISSWPQGRCDGSHGKLGLTTQGEFVSSEFYLQVVCKMNGTLASTPKIICPFDINYLDPNPKPVSLPTDWNPQIYMEVDLGSVLSGEGKKKNAGDESHKKKMIETEMVKASIPNT